MDKTEHTVLTKGELLYRMILFLYPSQYRKEYEIEMIQVFRDMYQEECETHETVRFSFWVSLLLDTTKGLLFQHFYTMKKQGIKKYLSKTLHMSSYNIVGFVLLLPVLLMIFIDIISRTVQGDLSRYNRPVYHFLSHTPLYWYPVLFTWAILFPTLAVLVNFIPLVSRFMKKSQKGSLLSFVRLNGISIAILGIGIGFLALIKLHDFAPCMVHGLLNTGFGQLPKIISVCQKA